MSHSALAAARRAPGRFTGQLDDQAGGITAAPMARQAPGAVTSSHRLTTATPHAARPTARRSAPVPAAASSPSCVSGQAAPRPAWHAAAAGGPAVGRHHGGGQQVAAQVQRAPVHHTALKRMRQGSARPARAASPAARAPPGQQRASAASRAQASPVHPGGRAPPAAAVNRTPRATPPARRRAARRNARARTVWAARPAAPVLRPAQLAVGVGRTAWPTPGGSRPAASARCSSAMLPTLSSSAGGAGCAPAPGTARRTRRPSCRRRCA
jgi:hypothetical protein